MAATNSPSNTSLPAYTDDDARALFDLDAAPPPDLNHISPLRLPLCIPQLTIGIEAPFARAYNYELLKSGIEQVDLLKFIDGLNMAMAASPPLRVVDSVGKAIGMVPYHWAVVASVGMTATAELTAVALSKGLTDRYLRIANESYFAPRGLRVRLCKTNAVRQIAKLDPESTKKLNETLRTIGTTAERIGLSMPIVRHVIVRLHPAPKVDTQAEGGDITRRRLAPLQGHVIPLEYDMPPPRKLSGPVEQMNALGVKLNTWQTKRTAAKADRARDLLAGRPTTGPGGVQGILSGGGIMATRAGGRLANTRAGGRVLERKVGLADRKEASSTSGMLWIVVVNSDQDEAFQDTALADSKADVDAISPQDWERELGRENVEDEEMIHALDPEERVR